MKTPVLIVGGGPIGLALAGDLGLRGIACTLIERSDGTGPAAEDGHGRHPHDGVLPPLGHRPLGPDRRLQPRLPAGLRLGHQRSTATSSAASPSPRRRTRSARRKARKSASAARRTSSIRCSALRRALVPDRLLRLRHRAGRLSKSTPTASRARLRDVSTGERDAHRRRLPGRQRRGREQRSAGAGHQDDGRAGPHLHDQRRLPHATGSSSCTTRSPPTATSSSARKARGRRWWRSTAATSGASRWSATTTSDDDRGADARGHRACGRAASSISRSCRCCRGSVASWWRDSTAPGRVFIAGDAAHLTSPTGGFGMNTGLQDAVEPVLEARRPDPGLGRRSPARYLRDTRCGPSRCATSARPPTTSSACCRRG